MQPEPEPEPGPGRRRDPLAGEKVEENAIPEGVEESRYVLRGILTGRNNGFALAWRELKQQGHWPAGTQDGAKLDAVRAALAQLGGEVPPPAGAGRAGLRPAGRGADDGAGDERDRPPEQEAPTWWIERQTGERIHGQAWRSTRRWAISRAWRSHEEEAIDEDLIETIAALEAAR